MFARTILAISLGCAISSVVNAENTVSNQIETIPANKSVPIESYSLSQNKAEPATAVPAIDHQAVIDESSDAEDNADESSVNQPSVDAAIIDNTPPAPVTNTDRAVTTTSKNTPTKTTASLGTWTLDGINNSVWSTGMPIDGRYPVFAKLQVLLNDNHASPGPIDGAIGKAENLKGGKNNTLKAISAYQTMNNLPVTGILDQATWDSLNSKSNAPAFVEYTITEQDLKGPYAASIPSNYAEQAKMKGLYYTRVTEMLGEKFHMDEAFLKTLNPNASFKKAGEKIIVANVRNDLPQDIHLIIAHKGAKQLYLFNSQNKMIASFPATIGSTDTPSPEGTYTIKSIAPNPWYGYNPKNFVQGGNMKPLSLPPGPNNPVGNMWIGLSKPSFGIHGTPNPSTISKTASHGCIRLTNWDANDLAKRVKPGITVKFLE
ncbi:L,D-transpeptidase family protein [Acinetobacter populi]|uniref:Murein L,D-transpeptidase n=1 Tax=Acinetobacter populi TaxID=1582270 RepID=A0A1Z9YV55_9GAMM|nr:L,D-transpeptidase [Acinetobacter populi]OUY06063.1 murein L,D-transpeptidase [Acinetobacter populi]